MKKCTILCVDDEKMILDNLEDQIRQRMGEEFDIEIAESGAEALEIMEELEADGRPLAAIISDQMMPVMKGDEFLIEAHRRLPDTPKILLTGQADLEAIQNAINNSKLYRYISKPWEAHDLMMTVEEAARSYLQHIQLLEYNELLRALNRASQEISGEMNLNILVEKLITSTIKNTGAQKGYLVMKRDGELMIEAVSSILEEEASRLKRELVINRSFVTQNILEKINITLNSLDSNYHRMASPISNKGKHIGYVYVESSEQEKYFDRHQREVLEMLASQAAISLENASLYRNLELKNQDILDSIAYARRIQMAIMPQISLLQDAWPRSFVQYKPKAIVSGDFYWFSKKEDHLLVAAVDCTGHGVPGAFMSVMGSNFLNQIVNDYSIYNPDTILRILDSKVRDGLNQYEVKNGYNQDGMDIALISIHLPSRKVQYSGARRPLYLLRDEEIVEFSGTKASIGERREEKEESVAFPAHEFKAKPKDRVYLFSDGFVDQFGGVKGKKFGRKRFQKLLLETGGNSIDAQLHLIDQASIDWQGEQEQTDDILLIGLEF